MSSEKINITPRTRRERRAWANLMRNGAAYGVGLLRKTKKVRRDDGK